MLLNDCLLGYLLLLIVLNKFIPEYETLLNIKPFYYDCYILQAV